MINRRNQHPRTSRSQFHRRRTSKYENSTPPESDPSEEPKISVSDRRQKRTIFVFVPIYDFDVLGPEQSRDRFGRFSDPPEPAPRDDPIRPAGSDDDDDDDDDDDKEDDDHDDDDDDDQDQDDDDDDEDDDDDDQDDDDDDQDQDDNEMMMMIKMMMMMTIKIKMTTTTTNDDRTIDDIANTK